MIKRALAIVLTALALPAPVAAHPHIFIEAGLRLIVNDAGRAEAVEVTWAYDPLYSLLILEEYDLDDDYDGRLRPDEVPMLEGFDLQWVPGFEGDLYVTLNDTQQALGAPTHVRTAFEDGQVITTHSRALDAPAEGLILKMYDPGYYSAYEITRGLEITGPCTGFIDPANFEAATTALEEILFARPQADLDTNFPEVGEKFADTVMVSCE